MCSIYHRCQVGLSRAPQLKACDYPGLRSQRVLPHAVRLRTTFSRGPRLSFQFHPRGRISLKRCHEACQVIPGVKLGISSIALSFPTGSRWFWAYLICTGRIRCRIAGCAQGARLGSGHRVTRLAPPPSPSFLGRTSAMTCCIFLCAFGTPSHCYWLLAAAF